MAKKEQEKNRDTAPQRHLSGSIRARVIDEEHGLRLLSGIYAVRLQSRDYSLLIMEDYMPMLGEIEGTVVFLTETREVRMEHIQGFYKHQHNEFTLLVENEAAV